MRNKTVLLVLIAWFCGMSAVNAQNNEITGIWSGSMQVMKQKLTLVFHISENEHAELEATMDVIEQGAKNIEVESIEYQDSFLSIQVKSIRAAFEGKMNPDGQVEGVFKQGGFKFDMVLEKSEKAPELPRPQHPKPPFPYQTKDIVFHNEEADIDLAGTLSYPEGGGNLTAVILVSGSGPQNRDEEILGHKPFLVIADYLTRKGIAVLRYDDRGVGASGGEFNTATTADFTTDARAALNYLKNHELIDAGKIGVIGHSEGGMVAQMLAANNPDVAFVVMLAGPAQKGDELLLKQTELIFDNMQVSNDVKKVVYETNKKIYEVLKSDIPDKKVPKAIKKIYKKQTKNLTENERNAAGYTKKGMENTIRQVSTPWFRYFVNYDPEPYMKDINCDMLAIYATKDVQVYHQDGKEGILMFNEKYHKDFEVKVFEGLNHLFQHAETGMPGEYGKIEETISEDVLEYVGEWINKKAK